MVVAIKHEVFVMTKKKSEGKINDFHSNWLEIDGEAFKKLL